MIFLYRYDDILTYISRSSQKQKQKNLYVTFMIIIFYYLTKYQLIFNTNNTRTTTYLYDKF